MLSSREASSHESSVSGEPAWRVMIWVRQTGRWGFDALFHSTSAVSCGPRLKPFLLQVEQQCSAGAGLSGKGECGTNLEYLSAVPRGSRWGSKEESSVVTAS